MPSLSSVTIYERLQQRADATSGSDATVTSTANDGLGAAQVRSFDSGSGEGGSEVVSVYRSRMYVTNGEDDQIDVFDIETGILIKSYDLTIIPGYDGVNSVAVSDAGVAVAVEITDAGQPGVPQDGVIAFFDRNAHGNSAPSEVVSVGNLPDMVTYSADGTMVFVANEGEPTGGGDPMGSISVIDLATMTAQTFDFSAFDSMVDDLRDAGVRIFPGQLPSTDFEPEYIAEGADGNLYITLQEANAVAVFNLSTMSFADILPLGSVDHSLTGNGMDPSDRDGEIDIQTVPVSGLRMPDALATAEIAGQTYFLTANEGDARDEDVRVGDIDLDPTAFPDAGTLQDDAELGRLGVSSIDGDTDGDGHYDELFSYGSRSFTIFDASGAVVFDSGDDFEQIIASLRPANAFNNDDFPTGEEDEVDENRSDNKGPEPEAIEVGVVDGRTLAFIGLERDSGIMIYDITDPENIVFLDYIESPILGHISPEVITFIDAADSATGLPQIAVSYEVSGTTALFDLEFGRDFTGTRGGNVIAGTLGDDIARGGAGADYIDGNGGDDELRGNTGADLIDGGAGDDFIHGGSGNDMIFGGRGDDRLTGGRGADTFVFDLGEGNDVVTDLQAADKLDLSDTGLTFADLTITENPNGRFVVEYGEQGDSILVGLATGNTALDADDFLF